MEFRVKKGENKDELNNKQNQILAYTKNQFLNPGIAKPVGKRGRK